MFANKCELCTFIFYMNRKSILGLNCLYSHNEDFIFYILKIIFEKALKWQLPALLIVSVEALIRRPNLRIAWSVNSMYQDYCIKYCVPSEGSLCTEMTLVSFIVDSEEDKLSWMEVLSASIETDHFSSETFNQNRRSVRSRMDRRVCKTITSFDAQTNKEVIFSL